MNYCLLEMSRLNENDFELVEQAYQAWWNIYSEEYASRGQKLNPDIFWNTKVLAILSLGDRIIGTHIYNPFHVSIPSAIQHSYFSDLSKEKIQEMKQQKICSLMSMEYLLVHPDFRGSFQGFKWAEVIIGLGLKFMTHSPWDAAIGIARDDKKVTKMSEKMGATAHGNLEKMNTPCQIMLLQKHQYQSHPHQTTSKMIEDLWQKKNTNVDWLKQNESLMKVG